MITIQPLPRTLPVPVTAAVTSPRRPENEPVLCDCLVVSGDLLMPDPKCTRCQDGELRG